MTLTRGGEIFSIEKVLIKGDNIILDAIRGVDPFPTVQLNSFDLVSSSPIKSGSVEEFSIIISISKPVDSGFESPEFLLMSKNITKLFGEVLLKIVEVGTSGVTRIFLDPCYSS